MFQVIRGTESNVPLDQVNNLLRQLSPWSPGLTDNALKRALADPNFHLLVAVDDGRLVGMGSIVMSRTLTRHLAEIHDVVVDDRHRGQGIAREILVQLIAIAKLRSMESRAPVVVSLTSRPLRSIANRLYGKLGFDLAAGSIGPQGTNLYRLTANPYRPKGR